MKINLFIFFSLILISCQISEKNEEKEITNYHIDSSELEILKLTDFKKSIRQSGVRIWITYSLSNSGKIFEFEKTNGQWESNYIRYYEKYDSVSNRTAIFRNSMKGNPKSGWSFFMDSLRYLGIYTLNDKNRIENYGLCNDANTITVELKEQNKYYEFIYPCWDAVDDKTEINKIISILRLIDREFSFQVFPIK